MRIACLSRRAFAPTLLLALVMNSGCSSNPDAQVPPAGSTAKSALEFVNQSQLGQMLPAGARYQPDSAKDLGSGKFLVLDTSGKKFELTVTEEAGAFKTGEPTPVN